MDDLRILINAQLNEAQTTALINKQLAKMGEQFKVTIGVDSTKLSGIAKEIEKIQQMLGQKKPSIVDPSDTGKVKELYSSIGKVVEKYREMGTVKIDRVFNPLTNEAEKFNLTVETAQKEIIKLKFELASLQGMKGLGESVVLTGKSISNNSDGINEKRLRQEEQINNTIANQNKNIQHQLEMYKQDANLKANKLINTNTGKTGFDDTAIKGWQSQVNALNASTPNLNQQMDKLRGQFKVISSDVQQSTAQVKTFGSTLGSVFANFGTYALASAAFFLPFKAINGLIDTLYTLDSQLVSIDKVMENANMEQVFENATKAAYDYGQTIENTLASLKEIAALGYDQKDAEALNSNANLLNTVGEFGSGAQGAAEAANYLTAIMKQYKMEVADTTQVVSALNELSNKSGADTKSLAAGLSKSSSAAAMAKVNFNSLSAMIATTQETLHITGNEAGTFYKSLFTRFLRPETQKTIQGIGVATKDMNGNMRSATDVLADVGKSWGSLDEQTKNALAQQLGGVYHINKVSSLLENQARVIDLTNVSMNSYGSATTELKTFQEGLEYKTNEVTASLQALVMTIGQNGARDAIVSFLESTTSLIRGFTDLTEATNGWNIKLPLLAAGIYGGVKALGALRLAITGVKASFGLFSIGLIAVEALSSMFMESASSASTSSEALTELAQKTGDQASQLQFLISQYDKLQPQTKGNADKQKELQEVLQKIQELAPQLVDSTGKYGDALTLNKDKADKFVESLKQMTKEQVNQAKSANTIELNTVNVDLGDAKDKLKDLESSYKGTMDKITAYQEKYKVITIPDAAADLIKRNKAIADEIVKATNSGNTAVADQLNEKLEKNRLEFDQYKNMMEDTSGLNKYADQIKKVQDLEGKKSGLDQRQKALDDMINGTDEVTKANERNASALSKVNGEAQDNLTAVRDMTDSTDALTDSTLNAADAEMAKASSAEKLLGTTQSQIDSIYEAIAVYQLLNGQQNLDAQQKGMLADATATLTNLYPNLTKNKRIDIAAVQDEARSQDILLKALEMASKGQLTSQQMQTLNAALGAKARIEIFDQELQALQKLAQAYKESAERTYKIAVQTGDDGQIIQAEKMYKRYQATNEVIKENKVELNGLIPEFKDLTDTVAKSTDYQDRFASSSDKASKANKENAKSAKEAAKEYENYTYVTDKFKKSLEEVNLALEKQNSIQSKYPEWSKEYRASLEEEIKQLEKKKNLPRNRRLVLTVKLLQAIYKKRELYPHPLPPLALIQATYMVGAVNKLQDMVGELTLLMAEKKIIQALILQLNRELGLMLTYRGKLSLQVHMEKVLVTVATEM